MEPNLSVNHIDGNHLERRPWTYFAGLAIAASAAALLAMAVLSFGPPLLLSSLMVAGAALTELLAGLSLLRRGGAGIAHTLAGAIGLGLSAQIFIVGALFPEGFAPGAVALQLGVFCVCDALFRGVDAIIDRPMAVRSQALDAVVTLTLGVIALSNWQMATAWFVGIVVGVKLLVAGLTMAGTAGAWRRHPEGPAYDDYQFHITHPTSP